MINTTNWTRQYVASSALTYYGYASANSDPTQSVWMITRLQVNTTSSGSEYIYTTNNPDGGFESIWNNRTYYYQYPAQVAITQTGATNNSIFFYWNQLSGVSRYYITVTDMSGCTVAGWNNKQVKNITVQIISPVAPGNTYNILLIATNISGSTSTSEEITSLSNYIDNSSNASNQYSN